MGITGGIARSALRQARIELRVQWMSWTALGWLVFPAIGLVVLFFLRDQDVMGSQVTLAQIGIPGLLAVNLVRNVSAGGAGSACRLAAGVREGPRGVGLCAPLWNHITILFDICSLLLLCVCGTVSSAQAQRGASPVTAPPMS